MKTCSKCGAQKEETEFYLRRDSGKRRPDCKECRIFAAKAYDKENQKEVSARVKRYRGKHRERIKARKKIYHWENKDRIATKDAAYYTKNKDVILAKKKVYHNENREERNIFSRGYYMKNRKDLLAYARDCRYGLAPGDFEGMFRKQGGVCAICGGVGGKKGLCVDHDHENGAIRALLCGNCNIALGLFKDSSVISQAATDYLKKHGK